VRPDGSITHWIHEIKGGNRDAAQHLWERYFSRLVALAKIRIGDSSRRISDEEDVAAQVFESFWKAAESGRFPDLSDRDSLWRLLVKMTGRSVIDRQRRQNRQRRGGGRVRGESVFQHSADREQPALADVIGLEPTPEFVVMMREQVVGLLNLLDSDELRQLALAKMEGRTNKEIAADLDCSERTVERRLKLIRAKCDEQYSD
jgi:RNA polymerase sigma factor (sigma-70 family)